MKEYLTTGSAIAFLLAFIALNVFFLHLRQEAAEKVQAGTERAIQALKKSLAEQQAIVEKLERLIDRIANLQKDK